MYTRLTATILATACVVSAGGVDGAGAAAPRVYAQGQTIAGDDLQRQLLEELRAIRKILQEISENRPTTEPVPTVRRVGATGYALGPSDAPLTIVEFSDYQCPFCKEFALETFARIKENWVDSGKVRYVVRDLPLEIHPLAMEAARAARCAGDQDKFWQMRHALFTVGTQLSKQSIHDTALALGLNDATFTACAQGPTKDAAIREDLSEGARVGFRGTPTFVVGRKLDESSVEGTVIIGAQPYSVFDAILQRLLDAKKQHQHN